jgi:diacylglycerol kinase (ATP)
MNKFTRTRLLSFRHAIAGCWYVMRTQPNAWIHALATVLVVLMAFWLQLNLIQWAALITVIAMVWIAEFFNTALETVVDLASPQHHPLAKVGKDVGAAAVLIAAIAAAIVGFIIMGPPLWIQLSILFAK